MKPAACAPRDRTIGASSRDAGLAGSEEVPPHGPVTRTVAEPTEFFSGILRSSCTANFVRLTRGNCGRQYSNQAPRPGMR